MRSLLAQGTRIPLGQQPRLHGRAAGLAHPAPGLRRVRLAVFHHVVVEFGDLHPADNVHHALHRLSVGGLQHQHAVVFAIGPRRQLPFGEDLGAALVGWAGGIGHRAGEFADFDDADTLRHGEIPHLAVSQRSLHDIVPDGRCAGDAGDSCHL